MSLVLDRRAELAGQPACHALIVGVSEYTNLGGIAEPPGAFGLKKLASAALTGFRIFQWLEEHKDSLSAKLATCRLLLAPSPAEVAVEAALKDWPHACTMTDFKKAAREWRDDCLFGKDNFAFFYFSGHGIQRTGEDSILLLQDFDFSPGTPMEGTVSLNNIFFGMAPGSSNANIARSQIYFVDACREFPKELKEFDRQTPGTVFTIHLTSEADDRRAPIFFAAVPGSTAFGLKGKGTVFGRALLECLNLAAKVVDDAGNLVYQVGSEELKDCLDSYIDALPEKERGDQAFVVSGLLVKDGVVIHRLAGAPNIPITIELIPVERFEKVQFTIVDDVGNVAWQHVRTVPPVEPLELMLPLGTYQLVVKPEPEFAVKFQAFKEINPPRSTWPVRPR